MDTEKRKKILGMEPNVFFTGLTSFLTDTSTKMVYAVMPLFLLSIGASKTELSLIEGIAESTASVLKAISGWWSDKIGKNKPFMTLGYLVTALITPIYSSVASPIQVLYLRFIERVGKGIRTAPRDSLIAGSTDGKKIGKNFGFHKTMDNAGAIIGPLLAVWIMAMFANNYRLVFLLAAIPAALGVIVIMSFIKEAKKSKESLPGKIVFKDFSKRFYAFLFIAFIFTLGNSTDALLLVKAKDAGFSNIAIPMLYLVFNVVSVIFAIPMGMLSDKIGRERLIIFGFFLYSIIYLCFGAFSLHYIIITLFALYGLYSASTDGIQKALVSDLIDSDKRGTGLGLYNAVLGITLLPASLIAGVLYDKVNSSAPFYFGAAMSFIAAVLMIIFYGKRLISNKNVGESKA
ncbi:MAG: MFS transporter [Ignavibacteriales bacterium]